MKVMEGKLFSLVTAGSQIKLISMDKEGKVEEIAVSLGSIDCSISQAKCFSFLR